MQRDLVLFVCVCYLVLLVVVVLVVLRVEAAGHCAGDGAGEVGAGGALLRGWASCRQPKVRSIHTKLESSALRWASSAVGRDCDGFCVHVVYWNCRQDLCIRDKYE
jgi:hypothetical protein